MYLFFFVFNFFISDHKYTERNISNDSNIIDGKSPQDSSLKAYTTSIRTPNSTSIHSYALQCQLLRTLSMLTTREYANCEFLRHSYLLWDSITYRDFFSVNDKVFQESCTVQVQDVFQSKLMKEDYIQNHRNDDRVTTLEKLATLSTIETMLENNSIPYHKNIVESHGNEDSNLNLVEGSTYVRNKIPSTEISVETDRNESFNERNDYHGINNNNNDHTNNNSIEMNNNNNMTNLHTNNNSDCNNQNGVIFNDHNEIFIDGGEIVVSAGAMLINSKYNDEEPSSTRRRDRRKPSTYESFHISDSNTRKVHKNKIKSDIYERCSLFLRDSKNVAILCSDETNNYNSNVIIGINDKIDKSSESMDGSYSSLQDSLKKTVSLTTSNTINVNCNINHNTNHHTYQHNGTKTYNSYPIFPTKDRTLTHLSVAVPLHVRVFISDGCFCATVNCMDANLLYGPIGIPYHLLMNSKATVCNSNGENQNQHTQHNRDIDSKMKMNNYNHDTVCNFSLEDFLNGVNDIFSPTSTPMSTTQDRIHTSMSDDDDTSQETLLYEMMWSDEVNNNDSVVYINNYKLRRLSYPKGMTNHTVDDVSHKHTIDGNHLESSSPGKK